MKKAKIIIMLLVIILLSGCTKEYNLLVNDDKIIEEFNVIADDSEVNIQRYNLDYFPLHANEKDTYNKKLTKKNNQLNAHFNYTYKPSDFVNANSINECFETREILVDDEKYYYFRLEDVKDCMSDYNLNINIITKNKVLKNNADEVKKNKYIWHMTNENKSDFKLEIKIRKNYSKNNNFFSVGVVLIAIILIVILGLFVLIVKRNKSNEI